MRRPQKLFALLFSIIFREKVRQFGNLFDKLIDELWQNKAKPYKII